MLIERLPRIFRTTAYLAATLQILAVAIAGIVVGAILLARVNDLVGAQVVETLRSDARGLAEIARAGGRPALEAAIAGRQRDGQDRLFILVDGNARKLAGNLNRWPPELDRQAAGGLFRYLVAQGNAEAERLAAGVPLDLGGGLRLVVGRDIEEQRRFLDGVRWLIVAGLAVIAAAGIVVGILASRYVLRRISSIAGTAETIMGGDLGRRIPLAGSGDEMDELAERLNAMLDRIERLLAGLREVSDNIAHDLKTPLNRLRNRAEEALRSPAGAPAYQEGLQRTIEAADEIIKTFNALLLIARVEAGSPDGSTERFDVSEAITDLVDLYGPACDEAGFAIRVTPPPGPTWLLANRQLVMQAVANLIENAIKYGGTGEGGSIDVAVRCGDGRVVIAVSDRGAGIPEADRARVLDRFVRLDQSRTKPGTGLGLALVAAVARLHGGVVELGDHAPGLTVRLVLPAADACPQPSAARTHGG
jgi:signal transduction histidine kinase